MRRLWNFLREEARIWGYLRRQRRQPTLNEVKRMGYDSLDSYYHDLYDGEADWGEAVKVLITGAAGFIGSTVADALHEIGHDVWGWDNLITGRRTNLPETFPLRRMDIRFLSRIPKADLIVHCAASYSDPHNWRRDVDTNTYGTALVAQRAKEWGAHLIYCQTALPPTSSYSISKIAGQHYIEASGCSYTTFRLANMYGPRNLSGAVPTFWRRLSASEPCTVMDTYREMVFVDDLVELMLTSLDVEHPSGIYDVCSENPISTLEVYHAVAHTFGDTPPVEVKQPDHDDVVQMELDGTLAFMEFGWKPSTDLRQGIQKSATWYRENEFERTYTHLSMGGR